MTVVRGFSNPPWFISGQGTHAEPWCLKVFSSVARTDNSQFPPIISLGDDPDGFFQSSPPAPIDLAVIFTNFKRLGKSKVASGVVLAWETPDPIGLAALEKAMTGFESLVVTAPLSRGAVSSVMPPSFRRASISVSDVLGDTSLLPIVNRIPLPGVVLGGDYTAAGFSGLESENLRNFSPMMARWEDRVVFSFSLLAALQRLDCPVSNIEVKLGEYLKLGNTGRVVPIDSYGRLTLPVKKNEASAVISAEAVVDGDETLFQKTTSGPVLLRDDRTSVESNIRNFSRSLTATITALASDHGMTKANHYPRLKEVWEILILAATILILSLVPTRMLYPCACLAGCVGLASQWILLAVGSLWLPGLATLVAVFSVILARKFIRPKISEIASVLVEQAVFKEDPASEVIIAPAPNKKAVSKNVSKKTASKKTATKRAPRRKKPLTES